MAWACADIPYEKQGFVNHIFPCHVGSEDQQVSPLAVMDCKNTCA